LHRHHVARGNEIHIQKRGVVGIGTRRRVEIGVVVGAAGIGGGAAGLVGVLIPPRVPLLLVKPRKSPVENITPVSLGVTPGAMLSPSV